MLLAVVAAGCDRPSELIASTRDGLAHPVDGPQVLKARFDAPDTPAPAARPGFVEVLTLPAAVTRATSYSPAIKAAFLEVQAKHGEEIQAGVRPNPELLLEVENFGGTKGSRGYAAAEETVSITHTIELGDKRVKRLRAAHLDASLSGWDFETIRLQTALQAALTFIDVLASQERVQVLRGFVTLAERTNAGVDARINAGRASPIEADRSQVVLARARALVRAEEVRLDEAKRKLSAIWGAERPDFGRAQGRLVGPREIPSVERVKAYLDANPALARWSDGIGHRVAQLDLERAKAFRDVKVSAGVRRFNEDDSVALVASIAVPLQIFDKNVGNITAAERRVVKAEHEQKASRNQLVGALVEALGNLKIASAQVTALENEVLPAAERAFERTQIGFNEGRFDILNVLDTQRTVFEARLERVNAQAEYAKARAQVEALIGRSLGSVR